MNVDNWVIPCKRKNYDIVKDRREKNDEDVDYDDDYHDDNDDDYDDACIS